MARRGDRFAALEPIYSAVRDRFGVVDKDVACGVAMRHDWGPQYTSGHFTRGRSPGSGSKTRRPSSESRPANGCAERFIRTLKEQCIWAKLYASLDELREAIAEFIERYNSQWLIERHGHRTPREVYTAWLETKDAA